MNYANFNVANVEYELERMRNDKAENVGCGGCSTTGCLKVFFLLFVGFVIFRLILELFSFIG